MTLSSNLRYDQQQKSATFLPVVGVFLLPVPLPFSVSSVSIFLQIQAESGPKLTDFKEKFAEGKFAVRIGEQHAAVQKFARQFRLPGHDDI